MTPERLHTLLTWCEELERAAEPQRNAMVRLRTCADDETDGRVMMHVDPDDLALMAIGEGSAQQRAHVDECSACRADVQSVALMSYIVVSGGPMPVRPPGHVWAAIESAIRQGESEHIQEAPAPESRPDRSVDEVPIPVRSVGSTAEHRSPRRTFSAGLLGAAAAGAVAAVLGTTIIGGDDPSDTGSALASVELEALNESVSPGAAQIVERDGQRVLQVEAGKLPTVDDSYLEVWLLQPDDTGMVTLGLLEQGDQEFLLPEGLSTSAFGVVDVSVERFDGDPAHSGESLWRGPIASPLLHRRLSRSAPGSDGPVGIAGPVAP